MPEIKQRLWVISELFYPEQTSTGYFLTEIAKGLSDFMDVQVVCGQPTYSEHGIRAPRKEIWEGMAISRLPATSFRKDRLPLRAINAITLTISLIFFLIFNVKKNDKVLLVTNPPTFTPIVSALGKIIKFKSYLLIHDVYPEILYATGFIQNDSPIYRLISLVMNASIRSFGDIIVLGHDMQEILRSKTGFLKNRIHIITNWADHNEINPIARTDNAFIKNHRLMDKAVFQFSGNIGRTHDVESILKAAEGTSKRKNIKYIIAGYGGKAEMVKTRLSKSEYDNLLFLDRQPRHMLGPMLSSATAVIIPFNDAMLGLSVPSRMYNVFAAGTPIIAMADPESELAMMVSKYDAGWIIAPHDSDALTRLVLDIATAEGLKEAKRKGECGRRAVCEHYTFHSILESYKALLLA